MPLDMATAMSQYGYIAQLAALNPELQAKLDQAVRDEWDSARFDREVQNTGWYKSLSERRRQIEVQKATDPATWSQTLSTEAARVWRLALQLGLSGVDANRWATLTLEHQWDDATLTQLLIDQNAPRDVSGGLTGVLGDAENHIRKTWAQYGLDITAEVAKNLARETVAGRQTLGGLDNEARNYAKKSYPAFADQFDTGMTLQDIASPYMQTMANTLEMTSAVSLKDPSIKRALQGTSGQPMSMWEFERSLKDDARWQNTKQAKDETYAVLQQVGNDWGFL